MSTANISTANRLGIRALSGYQRNKVYRAPAEARPRAAQNVQDIVLGAIVQSGWSMIEGGGDYGNRPIAIGPARFIPPVASSQPVAMPLTAYPAVATAQLPPVPAPPVPPVSTTYANGSPSQSPTGSTVNSSQSLSTPAATPNFVAPPTPTSVATVVPSSPSSLVVTSGGGTVTPASPVPDATPDYFAEATAWLQSTSLLASIIPNSTIPNWLPVVGIAAALMMVSSKKGKR